MAEISDYIIDSPKQQTTTDSWFELASREWQTFGEPAFRGAWQRGTRYYAEHPLSAVCDVTVGLCFEAAITTGPAYVRAPALAMVSINGLDFASNFFKQVGNAIPRMQEIALNPQTASIHRQWAETNLGQLTFDTAVYDTTLGMSTAGSATLHRFAARFTAPETAVLNNVKLEKTSDFSVGASNRGL
jgi:hypothetical protein